MKNIFLLVFFAFNFSLSSDAGGSKTEIYGNATDYATEVLTFYIFSDYITYTEQKVASAMVSEEGNFHFSFNISRPEFVFSRIGIYRVYLFAEPGKEYEIILPGKQDKSPAQRMNPFFQEADIFLGINNTVQDDLNILIRMFDDAYKPFLNKFAMNIYDGNEYAEMDDVVEQLKVPYTDVDNDFFQGYMFYSIGMLRHLSLQFRSKEISDSFFSQKRIRYNNPAYMDLFNQVYDKYFDYFSRTRGGGKLAEIINRDKDYFKLNKALSKDNVLQNDTLRELVILKNLHDEFYDDNYLRSALLEILDTLITFTPIDEHKIIGKNIKGKVTRLLTGYEPIGFELYDRDDSLVKLSDFSGKYVYLNFCSCSSYGCIKEFEMLKYLQSRIGDKLEIITIAFDDAHDEMVRFLDKADYNWTFLYYGNKPEILNDYDIRGFPTYYLIGPDGKLVLSPAPSPGENFSQLLFQIMRDRGDI